TPRCRSLRSAVSTARAMLASTSDQPMPPGSQSVMPLSDAPSRSVGLQPLNNERSALASATSRASGPIVSKVGESGIVPFSGTRPAVVLRPTNPFQAAGMRTEPPVSVPIEPAQRPRARATPAPDDEPPGARSIVSSKALAGVPQAGLTPS